MNKEIAFDYGIANSLNFNEFKKFYQKIMNSLCMVNWFEYAVQWKKNSILNNQLNLIDFINHRVF